MVYLVVQILSRADTHRSLSTLTEILGRLQLG